MLARFLRLPLVFMLFILLASCSGSDNHGPYANTITQITASMQRQLAESRATGGVSIALVDDQKVVWTQSFGYPDAGSCIPATPDTTYRICSITKTFTGTMIMQLSEQELLDIGDPLSRHIPVFSINPPLGFAAGGPITIRSILTHHSGIPGDINNGVMTAVPDPDFNAKLLTYLQGEYLTYPANVILEYSNSAISLLATVIANAVGHSFQTYSDALFQTLGMDRSSISMDSPKVTANPAKGYQVGQEVPRFYNNGSSPVQWDQARLDTLQGIYVLSTAANHIPYLTVRSVPGALEWTNPDDGRTHPCRAEGERLALRVRITDKGVGIQRGLGTGDEVDHRLREGGA